MASKENKRSRNMKPRLNVFNSLNKNSRIVNFGTELLSNANGLLTVDSARNSATKTGMTIPDILIEDDTNAKQYVLACVRKNYTESDNLTARFQEHISRSKSAITNGTQTFNETRDNLSARQSSRQRETESYSRKISELDNDAKSIEDTLDDVGVFRTDGVGGKSVSLSNVKPKYRLSLQETDSFKSVLSNGRPLSLPLNKNGLMKNNSSRTKRAFSVLSASDVVDKNGHFRTRSKSDPPHPNKLAAFDKHPKQKQLKKPLETTPKTINRINATGPLNKPVDAWAENKVEMVTVATQTEEEYTGQLIYVDEIDDSVGPSVDGIEESGIDDTAKTNAGLENDQRGKNMPRGNYPSFLYIICLGSLENLPHTLCELIGRGSANNSTSDSLLK